MAQYVFTMNRVGKIVPPKRQILKDISLSFFPGAKIGVLGLNGSGKSTLLRIMAGVDKEYEGEATPMPGLSIGYLPQEPQLDPEMSVREAVEQGLGEILEARKSLEAVYAAYAEPDADFDALASEQARLEAIINAADGHSAEVQMEVAADALRLPPWDARIAHLSGGEKRRVALCRLLISKPDMLLLDEPTNHLDAESVDWLEQFLQRFPGTVVAVTHDRYFLDNAAEWILELDRGHGIPWKGNYSSWLEQKENRLKQEEAQESARQKAIQKELEWVRQNPKGRQAKSKARLSRFEELSSQEYQKRNETQEIFIPVADRLGGQVIEFSEVSKGFGDRLLLDRVSFAIPPGAIVGIIGPNGAGKSTLFRMISGQDQPDSGQIRVGPSVKLSTVDQSRDALDNKKTVWEAISGGADILTVRELGGLSEQHADLLRIHALAATQLSDVVDETVEARSDSGWRELLQRRDALSAWRPEMPEGLQAELRDYQRYGFEWLARHAQAGAGACLADDMGLGKTLQALALLLHRTSQGPALVVAPTSVCGNWDSEARRFAPSLNIRWLNNSARDRNFSDAGPGELIIMSYTLFQQEAEALAAMEWATVVLDEAQAIKNAGTKRSQAAMKLKARFRMITTGTPIENHLGELWNLFRFINPGLLGSLDSFTERFAVPIEKNNDSEARERLRRLIQPFVLRRTKTQVLSELPQRTEVTLALDLSPDERAMYEAVRLEALESVTVEGEDQPNRIRVLAGIMKLRRACCHGSLILPDREWPSGKITALMEIVEELRESDHRALVFSQFVDYLEIIREALNERGVSYQYLDGSTPSAERTRRVKAFQEGEGDLFLISLKAGGVGLNLTAADYVIHMDPWWNPAVEDQASDRAHRIGQTRPVTVYRLIARDTIEEKIVALHERKRHLADSLLEGAGEVSTISTEELISLLQEDAPASAGAAT